ncbi:MAG TPA: SDR family oxidoreductase [Candidatus Thermoplasmatota archaeon]|nr:SDR family oxidoreductase [Candidatus Thermoplasmatota archaeon]
MERLLSGKDIIVTGAAQERSIGDAIARACAEHGAHVHVLSRRADTAIAAAKRLEKEALRASGHGCDITSDASVDALARAPALARVAGIVHNAGAPVTQWARSFDEVPIDEFRAAFEVDVLGAARLSRALLPRMKERGGSLVFTSSTAAIAGYEFLHEFAPAKAGVLGLMRGLAAEFGRDGIRANAVAYGNISSPATWDSLDETQRSSLALESPMRRWGTPREAAGASVFLLSDLSSFVNGQTLIVDGGTVMR